MAKLNKTKLILVLVYAFAPFGAFIVLGNIYAAYRLSTLKQSAYRAHDAFTIPDRSTYKPNLNTNYRMHHGDLCEIAGYPKTGIKCPFSAGVRTHDFITDAYGFKTKGDNTTSKIILVGDSFTAASGGERMNQQLDSILSRKLGLSISAAAHPGGLSDYISRIDQLASVNTSAKFIIIMYEGNDIQASTDMPPAFSKSSNNNDIDIYGKLKNLPKSLEVILTGMPLAKLVRLYIPPSNTSGVSIDTINVTSSVINGRLQAFLKPQTDLSTSDATIKPWITEILNRKDRICEIVFVPTAFSVYLTRKSLNDRHPTLAKDFRFLKSHGISTIDLTSSFQDEFERNPSNRLWWTDDTHWNAAGIRLASDVVSKRSGCISLIR
jgi:hypothetical protein